MNTIIFYWIYCNLRVFTWITVFSVCVWNGQKNIWNKCSKIIFIRILTFIYNVYLFQKTNHWTPISIHSKSKVILFLINPHKIHFIFQYPLDWRVNKTRTKLICFLDESLLQFSRCLPLLCYDTFTELSQIVLLLTATKSSVTVD